MSWYCIASHATYYRTLFLLRAYSDSYIILIESLPNWKEIKSTFIWISSHKEIWLSSYYWIKNSQSFKLLALQASCLLPTTNSQVTMLVLFHLYPSLLSMHGFHSKIVTPSFNTTSLHRIHYQPLREIALTPDENFTNIQNPRVGWRQIKGFYCFSVCYL